MAYSRAQWRSGLTYQQTCSKCNTQITYMDDKLDFRPWYADGFIYCPRCTTPLRHNEVFAINKPQTPAPVDLTHGYHSQAGASAAFCTNCGRAFQAHENFCPACGAKRK